MRPENVLFVDDNELLRSLMLRCFKKEFGNVIAVGTGNEALQKIGESFYHIVILDKKLPDADGFDILDHIRETSPRSRVVMITSHAEENVREEALRRGALEFFEKPFDINKLKSVLRSIRVCTSLPARIAEKCRGVINNLSVSGMLVTTDAVLECGSTVDILLHTADGREIQLTGKVVRTADSACNPLHPPMVEDAMKYAIGIQLVEPPPVYSSFVNSLIN